MTNSVSTILARLTASKLVFRRDNPGGAWLEHKREDNEYHNKTAFGPPSRMGAVTGYFNRPVLVPMMMAINVPGMRGEQRNVREKDLASLIQIMGMSDKLPLDNGRQYAPFMAVDQEGIAWMNEGNHRIMAARKLGWKYIPIEIRYFTGGEDTAEVFSPAKLESYDSKAQSEGYLTGDDFRAHPEGAIT